MDPRKWKLQEAFTCMRGTFLPLSCLGFTHLTQMHSRCRLTWDQNNPSHPINTFSSIPGPVVRLQPLHCHPPWHSLVPESHPSWKTLMWDLPGLQRMCVHRAGRAGALLRAQGCAPALPGCRAGGCSHSWKKKQGRTVFAASPKPSFSMWFPSPQAVILCCPQNIRETTVPQLPVVLILPGKGGFALWIFQECRNCLWTEVWHLMVFKSKF